MPNTFTQIHIQTVFTVQDRAAIIRKEWKDDLFRYITAIIQNAGHKVLAINGMPDHVHVLFGMRPTQSLSDLMQVIKGDSSRWVNNQKVITARFSWQEGYGAFSYSRSHVPAVIRYIHNQEEHHRTRTFVEEYHDLLRKFEIPFDDRYSFQPITYEKSDLE